MTTSFGQNAIAVLIELAKQGEIDPWDVQVVDVFDRVLKELAAINQRDLSGSGQAFLYASILVLLKADSLTTAEPAEPETAEAPQDRADFEPLPQNLERHLRRRAAAQPLQRRRITLNELIAQLKLMTTVVEGNTNRVRPQRPSRMSRSRSLRAIAQLAHQENLSEVAAEVEQFLSQHWPQVSQGQDWLDLDRLLEFRDDRVGIFWALLFLCAQSKVELSQSEFYQDLKLRPLSPIEASLSNQTLGSP